MDQHSDESSQLPESASSSAGLPPVEIVVAPTRAPSLRRRLAQVGWALLAGAIVLGALWGIFFHKAAPTSPATVTATPTAALPMLFISSNVGYGTVTVNGVPQQGMLPLHLALRTPPPYAVLITAPPFRSGYCVVGGDSSAPTRPPNTGGGCDKGTSFGGPGNPGQRALFVNIVFTLDDLPPEQQKAVMTLVPQFATNSQQLAVPTQSYIATSITTTGVTSAQQSAAVQQATATLAPSTLFNQPPTECQDIICYGNGPLQAAPAGNFWMIQVPVALGWRFTNAAGAVVGEVALPYADLLTLYLAYDQAQGWHEVSPGGQFEDKAQQFTRLFCSAGATQLQIQAVSTLIGGGWTETPLTNRGAAGCLLDLKQNQIEMGHFLWRFGVVLVADDKAHTTLPALPVAPPDELAAVTG